MPLSLDRLSIKGNYFLEFSSSLVWSFAALCNKPTASFLPSRKTLEPFVKYVLDVYYNGVDDYGNQIEESSREESFEHRWNKARAILLKSK